MRDWEGVERRGGDEGGQVESVIIVRNDLMSDVSRSDGV